MLDQNLDPNFRNIYRAEDSRGNWTERLTIWVTQGRTSAPHLSYTLDRREIIYY